MCQICAKCLKPKSLSSGLGAQICHCDYLIQVDNPSPKIISIPEKRDALQDAAKATHGLRYDDGKPRMDLLCPYAMEGIAMVMMKGAEKYAAWNWAKGMAWSKPVACMLRHIFKFMAGEDIDKESGLPHVDHVATNAMFLCRYFRQYKNLDDRFK